MKEETEKLEPIKCIRCSRNARDSGVPGLCKKCAREMEALANRLSSSEVRIWFMEGKSIDFILRKVRGECLKTLSTIYSLEKENNSK